MELTSSVGVFKNPFNFLKLSMSLGYMKVKAKHVQMTRNERPMGFNNSAF